MSRRRKMNRVAIPLGIIALILAVVGAVVTVRGVASLIKNKAQNTADIEKYEQMLVPVVMFDPDPFDDLNKADKSQLLYSAIWCLLQDEAGMSKYPYSQGDTVGILVPQSDIEQAFYSLYGNEIDIASLHSQIDMSGYEITYDPAQQSYILPITGVDAAYSPKVYSIDKQGSSIILNVGYINARAWADINNGKYVAPEPDKFMKITLRERGDGMYISSIQAADSQEIASQFINTTVTQKVEVPEETQEEITSDTAGTVPDDITDTADVSESAQASPESDDAESTAADTQESESTENTVF